MLAFSGSQFISIYLYNIFRNISLQGSQRWSNIGTISDCKLRDGAALRIAVSRQVI